MLLHSDLIAGTGLTGDTAWEEAPKAATFSDVPKAYLDDLVKKYINDGGDPTGVSLHTAVFQDPNTGKSCSLDLRITFLKNVKTNGLFVIVTDMSGNIFDGYRRIGLDYGTQMRAYGINGEEVTKKEMEAAGFTFWTKETNQIPGVPMHPHQTFPATPPAGYDAEIDKTAEAIRVALGRDQATTATAKKTAQSQ